MKQKKDPSPSTSAPTSKPNSGASTPQARDQEVDTFLNGVLPSTDQSKEKAVEESGNGSSKIDISKAGLPSRPYFESNGPPREL